MLPGAPCPKAQPALLPSNPWSLPSLGFSLTLASLLPRPHLVFKVVLAEVP